MSVHTPQKQQKEEEAPNLTSHPPFPTYTHSLSKSHTHICWKTGSNRTPTFFQECPLASTMLFQACCAPFETAVSVTVLTVTHNNPESDSGSESTLNQRMAQNQHWIKEWLRINTESDSGSESTLNQRVAPNQHWIRQRLRINTESKSGSESTLNQTVAQIKSTHQSGSKSTLNQRVAQNQHWIKNSNRWM